MVHEIERRQNIYKSCSDQRVRAKAEVARAFTVYGGRLFLDAFRDELEELLRVLVLT